MKLLPIIFFTIIAIGCTNKSRIPSDVLAKDKMEKVLWDMMMADRFATQFIVKDSAKRDVTAETFRLYSQVFAMNKISREEFVRSYKFYMTRPDISKVLFDTILQRANRQKEELYRPRERLDTIKKVDTTLRTVAP